MIRLKTAAALLVAMWLAAAFSLPAEAASDNAKANRSFFHNLPEVEVHGFYEMRAGYRLRKDKYEKDMSVMENRLQLDLSSYLDRADLKFKGDFIGDLVTEQAHFDLREANIFTRPLDFMD